MFVISSDPSRSLLRVLIALAICSCHVVQLFFVPLHLATHEHLGSSMPRGGSEELHAQAHAHAQEFQHEHGSSQGHSHHTPHPVEEHLDEEARPAVLSSAPELPAVVELATLEVPSLRGASFADLLSTEGRGAPPPRASAPPRAPPVSS